VIFVSLDYMDTSFFQAYRRMIRGVRKTPLRITILEYARSLDRRIFRIVQAKSGLARAVDPTREVHELGKAGTLAPGGGGAAAARCVTIS
jgi:hypothetical protein